jgi:hypothetical protein
LNCPSEMALSPHHPGWNTRDYDVAQSTSSAGAEDMPRTLH